MLKTFLFHLICPTLFHLPWFNFLLWFTAFSIDLVALLAACGVWCKSQFHFNSKTVLTNVTFNRVYSKFDLKCVPIKQGTGNVHLSVIKLFLTNTIKQNSRPVMVSN